MTGTIEIIPARELQPGDVFSTDSGKVESVHEAWDGRVHVSVWVDACGGYTKTAWLDHDQPCPLWREG